MVDHLIPFGLRDGLKLAVVIHGNIDRGIVGPAFDFFEPHPDSVSEDDAAVRMNGHRTRADKVLERHLAVALRAQKPAVGSDERRATARNIPDEDSVGSAAWAPDAAELSWSFSPPTDHTHPAGRKVDHVDLGALHQGETGVRQEEAGNDPTHFFGETGML